MFSAKLQEGSLELIAGSRSQQCDEMSIRCASRNPACPTIRSLLGGSGGHHGEAEGREAQRIDATIELDGTISELRDASLDELLEVLEGAEMLALASQGEGGG